MTFFWYSKPYTQLRDWTKVYTSKFIGLNNSKIKINIGLDSHQIELEGVFTEIMAQNLPIKFVPDALEFELKPDLNIQNDTWSLSTLPFNIDLIDNFLKTPDCIFYNFKDDNWKVIRWELSGRDIIFRTIQSFKELDLILLSQSQYTMSK